MSMASTSGTKCKKIKLENNKLHKSTIVTPAGRRPEFVSKSSQPPDIDKLCSIGHPDSINLLSTVRDHFPDVTTGGCSGKSAVSGFPASSAKAELTSTRLGLPGISSQEDLLDPGGSGFRTHCVWTGSHRPGSADLEYFGNRGCTMLARTVRESVGQKPLRPVKKRKGWFELTEDEDEDPFHWSAPREDPFHWKNSKGTAEDKPDVEDDQLGDISPPPPGNWDAPHSADPPGTPDTLCVPGLSVVMPEPAPQSNLSRVIDLMHSLSASPPKEEPEEKTKPRRTYTEQQRAASKARKKAKRIRLRIARAASMVMVLSMAFLR